MITSIKIGLDNHKVFGYRYREGVIDFVGDAIAAIPYEKEMKTIKEIMERIARDEYNKRRRISVE